MQIFLSGYFDNFVYPVILNAVSRMDFWQVVNIFKAPYRQNANFRATSCLIFQIGWLNAIREWQGEFVGNMSSREFVDYNAIREWQEEFFQIGSLLGTGVLGNSYV